MRIKLSYKKTRQNKCRIIDHSISNVHAKCNESALSRRLLLLEVAMVLPTELGLNSCLGQRHVNMKLKFSQSIFFGRLHLAVDEFLCFHFNLDQQKY